MNDNCLEEIVDKMYLLWQDFGESLWLRPFTLRNALSDILPHEKRIIHCLLVSVQSGIAYELLRVMKKHKAAATIDIRKFESDLHEDYGLAWQYAGWLIKSWETLFCRIYGFKNSRPSLQVATREEVKRLIDMLPYYLRLERFKDYMQTAESLCRLNKPEGYYARGICYLKGYAVKTDEIEAFKSFLHAADLGLMQSQYAVAICYELGIGCIANISKAISWYKNASEQGYLPAEYELAELL